MVYLMFDGKCEEALKLYEKAFDAKIETIMKYKDAPANPEFPIAEEDMDKVIHSSINIMGHQVMGSDTENLVDGNKVYLSIEFDTKEALQKSWDVLAAGAMDKYMEPIETFFAVAHGSLRDRYGINWMFTVNKPM